MKSTTTDSEKVAAILFNLGAIFIRPSRPFKYTNGILSPVYTDNRLLMSNPPEWRKVIDLMTRKVKGMGKIDVIAGAATAGIPHAAIIAQKINLPMVYVRPQPKEHGKGNQIEGVIKKGQKVLVIEDLVSTGGSSIRVIKALRKAGAKVVGEVAIFTYGMKEAETNFKRAKVKLVSLSNFKAATKIAAENGLLKQNQISIVLDWAKDPKGWGKKMGFE
ncbi:MAG: orotate phosphoribosyltransferase [Candidatus Curtissbacteria bacterium]|nr:orotate phosphoribosyltransferase [Candidatus Curtissbacteria bacterium]